MDGMEVILKSVPSLFLTAYMQYTLSKMQAFVCHSMSVTPTLDPSKVSLVTIGLFGFSYCLVGAVVKTQPKHENILKEVDEETLDESVTEGLLLRKKLMRRLLLRKKLMRRLLLMRVFMRRRFLMRLWKKLLRKLLLILLTRW